MIRRFLYVSQGSRAVTGLDPDAIVADADVVLRSLERLPTAPICSRRWTIPRRRQTTWHWAGRLQPAHEATEKWITIRAKPRVSDQGHDNRGMASCSTIPKAGLRSWNSSGRAKKLRSLSRHLQTVREEEKARIAREVHDELGSTLTGLRIDLDWLIDHQATGAAGRNCKVQRHASSWSNQQSPPRARS